LGPEGRRPQSRSLIENRLAFHGDLLGGTALRAVITRQSALSTQDEIAYIARDLRRARRHHLPKCADQNQGLVSDAPREPLFFMIDEPLPGLPLMDRELAKQPTTPIPDEVAGYYMLYSSGHDRPHRRESSAKTKRTRSICRIRF